ncbi:MAG: hypothetical protein ACI86H_001475 [bacterium]|jgi:hypothetical protein
MKKIYTLLLLLFINTVLFSQDIDFTNNAGTGDKLWSTATNWTPNGVPSAANTVRLPLVVESIVDADFTITKIQTPFSTLGDVAVGGTNTITINAAVANAIAIENASGNDVSLIFKGKVNINNPAGFSNMRNANGTGNTIEFAAGSLLTLSSGFQPSSGANNNFIFNGNIDGTGNFRLGANTTATFGNTVSNTGYAGELVQLLNSSIIVNTADDVVFYDGLKIQVNGNNASATLNGANVFNSGIIVGGTNTYTLNVNKNQNAMTNIIFQGGGTLNLAVDNAVTNLYFANNSANDWLTGTINITGFKNGVIRFGTDNTGLTAGQLSQIKATGITAFALDSDGYLIDAATASLSDFEENTINPIAYPTLASDKIYFTKLQNNVKIFDITGKVLVHKTAVDQSEIEVENLSSGMYFIVFDNKKVERFLKK